PPERQRVADESRRSVADVRRIAREPRMSLAVNLEVIGMHLIDDGLDHRPRRVLADRLAVGSGMEVEVNAEEALGPSEPPGTGRSYWLIERCLDRLDVSRLLEPVGVLVPRGWGGRGLDRDGNWH